VVRRGGNVELRPNTRESGRELQEKDRAEKYEGRGRGFLNRGLAGELRAAIASCS
jgi:hypothetical protein